MATYFHHGSSEIQADGLQTLYLMNPNFVVGYSDTQQHPANLLFSNSANPGNALNPAIISHAPPPQSQQYVGVPLPAVGLVNSDDQNRSSMHEIPALHGIVPRFHYNLWGSSEQTTGGNHPGDGSSDVTAQMGFRRPAAAPTQQGLSLSLSPQQPPTPAGYRSLPSDHDLPAGFISPRGHDNMRTSGSSPSSVSVVSNGISGMQSLIVGSKYLKAAQEILDEVVKVGRGIKAESGEGMAKEKAKTNRESVAGAGESSSGGETSTKERVELTTAQRQELQMKKAKLVSMLEEVEQRYRHYHHQMQIVVTSFEQAAGLGSAKSYTALALQTISKQFRCLKDAISAQIKAAGKALGQEDSSGGMVEGSRLKFIDYQLRQQRAIQQLGMMQHNAWRPQRGLPERAVSVLRAWLFEHFLHPYPKDSDKHMLAKQTGLTRSQVSNWFINARVRLWKPMVEEMYMEETKDQQQNGCEKDASKNENDKEGAVSKSIAPEESNSAVQILDQINNTLQSKPDNPITHSASPTDISKSPTGGSLSLQAHQAGFGLIGSMDIENMIQRNPKKPRNDMQISPSSILSTDMEMKSAKTRKGINEKFCNIERQTQDSYPFIAESTGHGNGFGACPIGDLGRFNPEQLATGFHGNSVSLTLGLPHCENLSLSGNQQSYLSGQNIQLGNGLEMGTVEAHYNGMNAPQASHSSTGFEGINMQERSRFAAQLLRDFVA